MAGNFYCDGVGKAPQRSLFHALGMTKEEMERPLVGIVSSYNEIVPGHMNIDKIVEAVKMGVAMAGGTPVVFPAIAVCDGIAMGHVGMKYSLVTRDLIADSTECMALAHHFDALVMIPNCDKNVPGLLMAAARVNVPTVFVSGGPMLAGHVKGKKTSLSSMFEAVGSYDAGKFTLEDVEEFENNACPTCGSCSGMFTANSMNCLTEALGLSLPGNGTVLATHKLRTELFRKAAKLIVKNAREYYFNDNEAVLPRSVATRAAFLNAMSMDIAMGGSSNTVLHLLAVAQEAGVDFTMSDIDMLSRRVPVICKVAPNTPLYHIQDVNRAGGILSILGELNRGKLLDTAVVRVDGMTLGEAIRLNDLRSPDVADEAKTRALAAPGERFNLKLGSQDTRYPAADTDREKGCIRDLEHPYLKDGGLAVLFGNIARNGCIVKTAGVDESILRFEGKARVFESQEEACDGILGGKVKAGDVVVIRYEGPKGGPGMQEMLYPTSYLKSVNLGKACALITDGRFSGGTSGLSIGHVSPEAAAGGDIALVKDDDTILIDIPNRTINVELTSEELDMRRQAIVRFEPVERNRVVSRALKAYASMVTSADKGGVRENI